MLEKISINQLESTLLNGICHKNSANEYNLIIRLNADYEFYYNFDDSYNQDDKDFVFTITDSLEGLEAVDENGKYIENEIDEEYLNRVLEEYKDSIIYKLS
jgi:hypothetical protein